jgi:hypothetical protein
VVVGGSSSGHGRPRMAVLDRRGRGRGAGTEPAVGHGDDDQDDAELRPVVVSTSDAVE